MAPVAPMTRMVFSMIVLSIFGYANRTSES
jgi:hypothetical protein